MTTTPATVVDDLAEPVGLAWHDDALWIADRADRRVLRLTPSLGELVTVTTLVGDHPAGIAWTPTGIVVTAAGSRAVLCWHEDTGIVRHADLAGLATGSLHGVVAAGDGWFVTDEGAAVHGPVPGRDAGRIVLVRADDGIDVVAEELEAPAGLVVSDDGSTLFVAERAAGRITAYRIGADSTLSARRTWCVVPAAARSYAASPSGLAAAPGGGLWCTDGLGQRLVGVDAAGTVIAEVPLEGEPTACCWVGDDHETLAVAVRPIGITSSRRREGRIVAIDVAGLDLSAPVAAGVRAG